MGPGVFIYLLMLDCFWLMMLLALGEYLGMIISMTVFRIAICKDHSLLEIKKNLDSPMDIGDLGLVKFFGLTSVLYYEGV